jgi:pimeloyl-ACP methyl ester carboxylesterase
VPTLDRDGVSLHYDINGNGPRALLLSHGWGASSRMFAPNIEALAERHTVITWDLRGHGRSDYPTDPAAYSTPLAVADMAALLDEVGRERAVLGGHSLGGYLSLELAVAHPELVAALVLIDTGPGFRKDDARDQWNAGAERYATKLDERGLAGLAAGPEQGLDQHRDATGLAHSARGILVQHDSHVLDALPAIAVPALVLVGGEDEQFLPGARYMAAKIPGATLVEIAGAAHAPNVTHADEFDAHLLEFLDGLDAR